MSLPTALKGAVADARPLQNPDFRRLWVTQIITMIGAQLTARAARRRQEMFPQVRCPFGAINLQECQP
jgi:hypothetical protein